MGESVIFDLSAPIATITINRAERHNSLVPALLEQFIITLEAIQADENVRAVVLQANGRSFSTGGDLRGFCDHLDTIDSYAGELVGLLNQVMLGMMELRAPIVAAVHGIVTGGSLGLLLASDIVLLSPEASIIPYYSIVGFSPDGGWTALLPHIIGPKRAQDVLMSNMTINAEIALSWGLASHIVPDDMIRAEAMEIALEIAALHPGSIHRVKKLINGAYGDIAGGLETERLNFIEQISTPETQRSMIEFLDSM